MDNNEEVYASYFEKLISGNRYECSLIIKELKKSGIPVMKIYEEFFKKSLYKIGEMWEYNKISVAVEHMATSVTEGIMNELFPEIISFERKNRKVVVACIENETHQVGSRMVADIFEKNGWDSIYLGADTPINEIVKYCKEENPDVIALSLSVYLNIDILLKEIKELREITDKTIIIGGQALIKKGREIEKKYKNLIYLSNLREVEEYIQKR